jgi:hypothetical protein
LPSSRLENEAGRKEWTTSTPAQIICSGCLLTIGSWHISAISPLVQTA